MPVKVIEFKTEEDESVWVQVEVPYEYSPTRGGTMETSEGELLKGGSFRRALSTVRSVSKEVISTFKNLEVRPDEVEVKIALKAVSGTGNLWNFALVKAEGEGSIELTFKWKKNETAPES